MDFSPAGGLYAEAKLSDAVHELIAGHGAFSDRFTRAIAVLKPLSGHGGRFFGNAKLENRFNKMMARATSTPAVPDKSMVDGGLTSAEAERLAREIVALYFEIAKQNSEA